MTTVAEEAPRADRLLSVDEAQAAVLLAVPEPLAGMRIATIDALGRVLAAPVVSATALPPWDNSAMDGYAIVAADTSGADEDRPIRLAVVGEVPAGGSFDGVVSPGTAARIATGAPIPRGADAVVQVELTTPAGVDGAPTGPRGRDASGPLPAAVLIHAQIGPGEAIRRTGSDLLAGVPILDAGTAMTPAAVALAAGAGVAEVEVHGLPRVAVLATGDEVRRPGEPLGAAGIPDANGPGLRALVAAAGAEPVDLGIASDRLEDVAARLRQALAIGVDAIIVAGGVSVGPYDVVKSAFEAIGRIELWRVAVQPGKPFAFGSADRPGGGSPVLLFGLPGNPVSGFVTFDLFVRPALRRLAGRRDEDLHRPLDRAVLLEHVSKGHGRRAFVRVIAERDGGGGPARDDRGRVKVRLAGGQGGQGSHVMSALAAADALAVIPEAHDQLSAGAEVELRWLDGG